MAGTVVQAQFLMNVVRGIFTDNPRFAKLTDSISADTVSLRNKVDTIRPANYRTIRGITAVAAIAGEISMWQSDERGSKNPDREILAAVRPRLATTGGPSPYGKSGEPWRIFKKHFGPNGRSDIIVANGTTLTFNPTISQATIDTAYEEDSLEAAREWGGEFRNARDAYIAAETVEASIDARVTERPYKGVKPYLAHVDVSGGGDDSFAIAIGHHERSPETGDMGILDL